MDNKMLAQVVTEVIRQCLPQNPGETPDAGFAVPVGVSGRHVHLSQEDVELLFGEGHQLVKKRDLSQPGQFVCQERITIIGPKQVFQNVAVLGPARARTQVEISTSDARLLGIDAPVVLSGELQRAADVMLASSTACIQAKKSLMIAKNHVHMSEEAARRAGVVDGELVDVVMETARPITFRDVPVRAGAAHELELHIDFDEANACMYQKDDRALLIKKRKGSCVPEVSEPEKGPGKEPAGEPPEGTAEIRITTKFLTEQQLREVYLEGIQRVSVGAKTIISPLARDYARQNQMDICFCNGQTGA